MNGNGIRLYERCMDKRRDYLISASDVSLYSMSPFAVWCKYFASESEKDPTDKAHAYLFSRGMLYERNIMKARYPNAVTIGHKSSSSEERAGFDPVAAGEKVLVECRSGSFEMGVGHMAAGVPAISACPLYDLRCGMCGTPDIIERADGSSLLGQHHYIVKEIKSARRIKRHHEMQVAFYNMLIGRIQGRVPERFYIIDGDGQESEFVFSKYDDDLKNILARVAEIRNGKMPAPTYGACPPPWRTYCNKKAVEAGDISIIGGMRKRDMDALKSNGIATIPDILSLKTPGIRSKCGISADAASSYMQSATALIVKKPIRRERAKARLQKRETEIFLEMEKPCVISRNDAGGVYMAYMMGILARIGPDEKYVSFVADDTTGEKGLLDGFLGFMEGLDDYVVYHCNKYNRDYLENMMERYGVSARVASSIMSKNAMSNLHGMATSLYAFPAPGNGIDPIAEYVGFKRRHPNVDVNMPGVLYNGYCNDPDANADNLKLIRENNIDKCLAMAAVKDWIAGNVGRNG